MKTVNRILAGAALLLVPSTIWADNSFKDTYQFGKGSDENITYELTLDDAYRYETHSAYDVGRHLASGERTDMAVLESKPTNRQPAGPAIPGYIGAY